MPLFLFHSGKKTFLPSDVHSVFPQFQLHLKYVYVWVAAGLPASDTGSEVEKQSKNSVIF